MRATLLKRSAVACAALLFFSIATLFAWRMVRQHQFRSAHAFAVPPGIDESERVRLGGIEQTIRVRGRDAKLPLLLFLDGGPGIPELPFTYVDAELARHFIVVHWDQRGAGKSFDPNIPPASMNVAQLVHDAGELVDWLRDRYAQEQIFLAGHSTGTVIAVLLVQREPQLFRAYIGISQVADLQRTESFLYDLTTRAAAQQANKKAQAELREIGPPPFATVKQLQVSQKWVNHFAADDFAAISFNRVRLAFLSPDYRLLDLIRLLRGAKFSFDHLWREFFAIDLFQRVPRLDVPVYFLEGRRDRVATGEIAAQYLDALEAPRGKQLIWFEQSGHWPQLDEASKFQKAMVERVLAENPKEENATASPE